MSMNTHITLEVKFYSAVLCEGLGLGLETRVSRSWSRDQGPARSWSWSRDHSVKLLVLVSSFLKGLDNNTDGI